MKNAYDLHFTINILRKNTYSKETGECKQKYYNIRHILSIWNAEANPHKRHRKWTLFPYTTIVADSNIATLCYTAQDLRLNLGLHREFPLPNFSHPNPLLGMGMDTLYFGKRFVQGNERESIGYSTGWTGVSNASVYEMPVLLHV